MMLAVPRWSKALLLEACILQCTVLQFTVPEAALLVVSDVIVSLNCF